MRNQLDGNYLYDYGARWYDASIGRFTGVDPIAESFPHVNVYNYAENRPIDGIDLWGLQNLNMHSNLFAAERMGGDIVQNYRKLRHAQGLKGASPEELIQAGVAINHLGDLISTAGITSMLFTGGTSSVLVPIGENLAMAGVVIEH